MLNVPQAWQYSTGAGVTVALIDTGVTPNPRLPALFPGGDYVMGLPNRGVNDCGMRAHGGGRQRGGAPRGPVAAPRPKAGRGGRTATAAGGAGQPGTHLGTAQT